MRGGGAAHDNQVIALGIDRDVAALEPQRMAEGNQFMRTLGGERAGDDRRTEDRPFRRLEAG
jgi:hypothetical protein